MNPGPFLDQLSTSSRSYRILVAVAIFLIAMLLLIQYQFYGEQQVPVTDTIKSEVFQLNISDN